MTTERAAYKVTTLGALCSAVTKGTTPTTLGKAFQQTGINFVKVESIDADGRFVPDKFAKIDQETHDLLSRSILREGDILFSIAGAIGRTALVHHSILPANTNQAVAILRCIPDEVERKWLYHYLRSSVFQNFSLGHIVQAAQANLSLGVLKAAPITLPPREHQQRIAAILSAYDDLIENNTRRIAILEEMARRIYEEWFVRFRFPGHEQVKMVESKSGLIPEGWRISSLGNVVSVNAHSIRAGNAPAEILYIDIASVVPGSVTQKQPYKFEDAPGRARRVVSHGDVIWSCVRPNRRSYALVLQPEPSLIASTGFAVLSAKTIPYSYLYFSVTTDDFVGYLTNHATGAAYPAVTASTFETAPILTPAKEVMNQFHAVVGPMLDLCETLKRKNANLRTTRDLLLPKLISGEFDVSQLAA